MSSKLTPLAASKTGLPHVTAKRYFVFSRHADAVVRKKVGLPDTFECIMSGGPNEIDHMKKEYLWLISHNFVKEYIFVAQLDPLDDAIPW